MIGAVLAKARERDALSAFIVNCKGDAMDLAVWLPALFLLGIVGIAAMFAFIASCDRV